MIHWIWLIPAVAIGGAIGVFAMCLMNVAKEE